MKVCLLGILVLLASCASQQQQETIADKVQRLGRAIAAETEHSPDCWTQAHEDLKDMGVKAVPNIRSLLLHAESSRLRAVCAKVLAAMMAREGIPDLIQALKDRDRTVRKECLKALEKFKDPSALDAMLRCFSDPDEKVRTWACICIEPFMDGRVDTALRTALIDPAFKVRFNAAVTLADRGNAVGIKVLVEALKRNPGNAWIPVDRLEKLTGHELGTSGGALLTMDISSDSEEVKRGCIESKKTSAKWLTWWENTGRRQYGK